MDHFYSIREKKLINLIVTFFCVGVHYTISADSQCYECAGPGCGDPFSENSQITKVPSLNGWCVVCIHFFPIYYEKNMHNQCELLQKTKAEANGQVTISRGPATKAGCSNKCDTQSDNEKTTTSCCCTSNLCNASSRLFSTHRIGLFVCLVTLRFFVRQY